MTEKKKAKPSPSKSVKPNKKTSSLPSISFVWKTPLILLLIGICGFLSSLSFIPDHPSENLLGAVGYHLANASRFVMGLIAYPFYGWIAFQGFRGLQGHPPTWFGGAITAASFLAAALFLNVSAELQPDIAKKLNSWVHVQKISENRKTLETRYNLGGAPVYFLYKDVPSFNLRHLFSDRGLLLLSVTTLLGCLWMSSREQILSWLNKRKEKIKTAPPPVTPVFKTETEKQPIIKPALDLLHQMRAIKSPFESDLSKPTKETVKNKEEPSTETKPPISAAASLAPMERVKEQLQASAVQLLKKAKAKAGIRSGDYTLPSLELLTAGKAFDPKKLDGEIDQQSKLLEETLLSFGIEAKVGQVHVGPRLLAFEVHPAIGVKVQKIKALEDDIALNLQAKSLRIIAPIPGKAAVGIEVPSKNPQEVNFRSMVEAYQKQPTKYAIPVILGKTVSGEDVHFDLAKMPHMIIAGATGSGKSVCVNTIIMSILLHASADEIRLLMVDPKKVELTPYSKLPHMIAPVITEPPQAAEALRWLVVEMERRYEILKRMGLRHIQAFNERQRDEAFESSLGMEIPPKMPYIVCIIDELADLMMTSPGDIETPIARIAQMARAVGIHMILATQRPSREVITGLIKANFPGRISFKVASRVNSQIVLDENGAECLLGNGDMLFLHPTKGSLMRAQGAFIRDEDINRVIETIEMQAPPNYLLKPDLLCEFSESTSTGSIASKDELFEEARKLVTETGTASTTFLQRKLRIGYARAASLMDELEEQSIVSSSENGKPRRVLMAKENPLDEEEV